MENIIIMFSICFFCLTIQYYFIKYMNKGINNLYEKHLKTIEILEKENKRLLESRVYIDNQKKEYLRELTNIKQQNNIGSNYVITKKIEGPLRMNPSILYNKQLNEKDLLRYFKGLKKNIALPFQDTYLQFLAAFKYTKDAISLKSFNQELRIFCVNNNFKCLKNRFRSGVKVVSYHKILDKYTNYGK